MLAAIESPTLSSTSHHSSCEACSHSFQSHHFSSQAPLSSSSSNWLSSRVLRPSSTVHFLSFRTFPPSSTNYFFSLKVLPHVFITKCINISQPLAHLPQTKHVNDTSWGNKESISWRNKEKIMPLIDEETQQHPHNLYKFVEICLNDERIWV